MKGIRVLKLRAYPKEWDLSLPFNGFKFNMVAGYNRCAGTAGALLFLAFFYGKFALFVLAAICEKLFYRTPMKTRVNPPEPLKRAFVILSGFFGVLRNGGLHMDKTYAFQIIQQIEGFPVYYFYGYSHAPTLPQTTAKINKAISPYEEILRRLGGIRECFVF